MLKPKREEIVKLIVQKAGLPLESSYVDYLSRQQLLELHSFLDVNKDKMSLAVALIKNIQKVCDEANSAPNSASISTLSRINELIDEARHILDIQKEASESDDDDETSDK